LPEPLQSFRAQLQLRDECGPFSGCALHVRSTHARMSQRDNDRQIHVGRTWQRSGRTLVMAPMHWPATNTCHSRCVERPPERSVHCSATLIRAPTCQRVGVRGGCVRMGSLGVTADSTHGPLCYDVVRRPAASRPIRLHACDACSLRCAEVSDRTRTRLHACVRAQA
jgi:hypothetical protein